ncbi:MAG: transposase [Polyangiaceae bacterium]
MLLGDRAGQRTARLVRPEDARAGRARRRHRGVQHPREGGHPRRRSRPPREALQTPRGRRSRKRLTQQDDGRLRYDMKKPWRRWANSRDRSSLRSEVRFCLCLCLCFCGVHGAEPRVEPLDLLSRLAAMVPPPRMHMIRFPGVLSSHCSLRSRVVPEPPPASGVRSREVQLSLFGAESAEPSRRPWARLLRHVFQIDVTSCPRCNAEMRWVEVATTPGAIARLFAKHGLAAPPPHEKPSSPGQLRLRFG